MIFALLPVKEPARSKGRLAGLLAAAERERLAWLMYRRTLGLLLETPGLDCTVVASSNAEVLEYARGLGAIAIAEAVQNGHSQSAECAARICTARGASTVIMVPIDVPLAGIEDFAELCRSAGPASVAIVPSRDGTGTNALVRTPPDVIESRFGPGSLEAHLAQARAKGIRFEVLRPPGLVFDLDTLDDVIFYLGREPAGPIAGLLREALVRNGHRSTPMRAGNDRC